MEGGFIVNSSFSDYYYYSPSHCEQSPFAVYL